MNEVLSFPLYHGTSSLFVKSIQQHGLGARNPITELDAIACLQHLNELACEHEVKDAVWLENRPFVEQMVAQGVSDGGMNFKHETTYLAASIETAVRYACSNDFGSELISMCVRIYDCLKRSDQVNLELVEARFQMLLSLTHKSFSPVLITIEGMMLKELVTEFGELPDQSALLAASAIESGASSELQLYNFRLLPSVICHHFRASRIHTLHKDARATADYRLIPIP